MHETIKADILKIKVNSINVMRYFIGYSIDIQQRVQKMIEQQTLAKWLSERYPNQHQIKDDRALFNYVQQLKLRYLKNAPALNKVLFDNKIKDIHRALGLHTAVSKQHGNRTTSKIEIRISTIFKEAPEAFLKMICVHELAHIKEKSHNKAFYQLCCYMEPEYFQLEFDTRLFLAQLELDSIPFFARRTQC